MRSRSKRTSEAAQDRAQASGQEALDRAVVQSNNALSALLSGPVTEHTLRRYRAYAVELVRPVMEHVSEGLLRPREAAAILLAASLAFSLQEAPESLRRKGLASLVREVFS